MMRIRAIGDHDLPAVDRLLMRAYATPSRQQELKHYLVVQTDGWFALEEEDELVAFGGAINYGTFCWVGLVATDLPYRGRGFATRLSAHLVDWAHERGCRTIALDASDEGRPVYERLGFVAVGETRAFAMQAAPAAARTAVRLLGSIDEITEIDQQAFGADRSPLLRLLRDEPGSRAFVAIEDGRAAGYLFARDRLIGPGCAPNRDVAAALLNAAASVGPGALALVPADSGHLALFSRLGLREERLLTHMRLGEQTLPGERGRLLAQVSYAAG